MGNMKIGLNALFLFITKIKKYYIFDGRIFYKIVE